MHALPGRLCMRTACLQLHANPCYLSSIAVHVPLHGQLRIAAAKQPATTCARDHVDNPVSCVVNVTYSVCT